MPEEKVIPEQSVSAKPDWKRFLSHKWVVRNIPFFLFIALLTVLYIYNGHYADKMVRRISASEKHIKELEFEYKTVKSDVIYRSKASLLAKAVENLGLKELTSPPMLLTDDKNENGGKDTGHVK
ncbi:MAG TPA: FtsL-like putative cell division protein [Ferruginibacter sp.]|nr:FtsL-like putative cell division protein [Ferruginibacter sp.]